MRNAWRIAKCVGKYDDRLFYIYNVVLRVWRIHSLCSFWRMDEPTMTSTIKWVVFVDAFELTKICRTWFKHFLCMLMHARISRSSLESIWIRRIRFSTAFICLRMQGARRDDDNTFWMCTRGRIKQHFLISHFSSLSLHRLSVLACASVLSLFVRCPPKATFSMWCIFVTWKCFFLIFITIFGTNHSRQSSRFHRIVHFFNPSKMWTREREFSENPFTLLQATRKFTRLQKRKI